MFTFQRLLGHDKVQISTHGKLSVLVGYVSCIPVALEYDPAGQAEQTEDKEDPAIAG
jgi:hypothetical protein